MAARIQAKSSSIPPRREPPALRINRSHGDTAGLERLLLQLAEDRAGSDARLAAALDELRSQLSGAPSDAAPARPSGQPGQGDRLHIETLERGIAELALRTRPPQAGPDANGQGLAAPNLEAQFQDLNAALEASLAAPGHQPAPAPDPGPPASGLEELQAIADRLQSIDAAAQAAGARAARIEIVEAQLAELHETVRALEPKIARAAERAAAETAAQIEESEQSSQAIARLDAIQRDLQALTQRAGRMDERTLLTLETISGTLQHLAERVALAEAAETAAPAAREQATESEAAAPDDAPVKSEVRIEPVEPELPAKQEESAAQEDSAAQQETALPEGPVAAEDPARDPGPASASLRPALHRRLASNANRPGKVLVIAAVALLILSAGLLYGRLKSQSAEPQGGSDRPAPTAPAPAEPPAGDGPDHVDGAPGEDDTAAGSETEAPQNGARARPSAPKRLRIPASRFDRATFTLETPQGSGLDLILK